MQSGGCRTGSRVVLGGLVWGQTQASQNSDQCSRAKSPRSRKQTRCHWCWRWCCCCCCCCCWWCNWEQGWADCNLPCGSHCCQSRSLWRRCPGRRRSHCGNWRRACALRWGSSQSWAWTTGRRAHGDQSPHPSHLHGSRSHPGVRWSPPSSWRCGLRFLRVPCPRSRASRSPQTQAPCPDWALRCRCGSAAESSWSWHLWALQLDPPPGKVHVPG